LILRRGRPVTTDPPTVSGAGARKAFECLPTLIVIRGNSGSGKSVSAREVRHRYGRGAALIELDYVRRVILREHGGQQEPAAPGMQRAGAVHTSTFTQYGLPHDRYDFHRNAFT
jgi:2-phosphoglycerate kinase